MEVTEVTIEYLNKIINELDWCIGGHLKGRHKMFVLKDKQLINLSKTEEFDKFIMEKELEFENKLNGKDCVQLHIVFLTLENDELFLEFIHRPKIVNNEYVVDKAFYNIGWA